MESVLRGAATYVFVWLIFRVAGKRSLAQITTFDVVLLLIISETTQAALIDEDHSFTNTILLISTMLGLDVAFSCIKQRFPKIEKVVDGAPLVLLDQNGLRHEAMTKERVDEDDILNAARELRGLANMEQIQYAVLEQTGDITVVPK
jgi:uncharacterized membrane protein YcaP (DUF421 family)